MGMTAKSATLLVVVDVHVAAQLTQGHLLDPAVNCPCSLDKAVRCADQGIASCDCALHCTRGCLRVVPLPLGAFLLQAHARLHWMLR